MSCWLSPGLCDASIVVNPARAGGAPRADAPSTPIAIAQRFSDRGAAPPATPPDRGNFREKRLITNLLFRRAMTVPPGKPHVRLKDHPQDRNNLAPTVSSKSRAKGFFSDPLVLHFKGATP